LSQTEAENVWENAMNMKWSLTLSAIVALQTARDNATRILTTLDPFVIDGSPLRALVEMKIELEAVEGSTLANPGA
jgi:hypothetical protein